LGSTITLTVDDDTDSENGILYEDEKITGSAPWDPNQSYVRFAPEAFIDLVPGQYITLSGGTTSKSLQIEEVHFEHVNKATDIAGGRGPAFKACPGIVQLRRDRAFRVIDD
jgi:hypothetical protein